MNGHGEKESRLTFLLDEYFDLQRKIFDYFGYVEDWRVLPINDARSYFWSLKGEGPGTVYFATTEKDLRDETSDDSFSNEIYTQRHLPKWVYRGKEFTMICVDTHTDGNQYLQIFDNEKERP